jgi:hypothetical protein
MRISTAQLQEARIHACMHRVRTYACMRIAEYERSRAPRARAPRPPPRRPAPPRQASKRQASSQGVPEGDTSSFIPRGGAKPVSGTQASLVQLDRRPCSHNCVAPRTAARERSPETALQSAPMAPPECDLGAWT